MDTRDPMPAGGTPATMWTLRDRATVRFSLPILPLAGRVEPLQAHLDLDADAVDETIACLVELRLKMLPLPRRN